MIQMRSKLENKFIMQTEPWNETPKNLKYMKLPTRNYKENLHNQFTRAYAYIMVAVTMIYRY